MASQEVSGAAAQGVQGAATASSAATAAGGVGPPQAGGSPTEKEAPYKDPGQEVAVGTAGPAFVAALANVLTHLASLAGRPQRVTRFHAVRAPQLSIHDYLVRIATFFQCSHECFVLGLVYIDRIVKLHPEFTICNLNIHRLLVTSVMLGAKFFDDVYYSNAYYAKVGGVRTTELNALEALFLRLIEWRLHVLPTEYEQYRNHVLTAVRGSSPSCGPSAALSAGPGASSAGGGATAEDEEHRDAQASVPTASSAAGSSGVGGASSSGTAAPYSAQLAPETPYASAMPGDVSAVSATQPQAASNGGAASAPAMSPAGAAAAARAAAATADGGGSLVSNGGSTMGAGECCKGEQGKEGQQELQPPTAASAG